MLTLTKASFETKLIIKGGGIILGIIFVLFVLFNIASYVKNTFYPPAPKPPTVNFGKLPLIEFGQNATDANLTYKLDTVSGGLTKLDEQVKVYKTKLINPDLQALKKTQAKVEQADFVSSPNALSDRIFQWKKEIPFEASISVDIFSNNFKLTSSFVDNENVLLGTNIPKPNEAVEVAEDFFNSLSSYPEDIDPLKTKTSLLTIENYVLLPATSISNAQLVRVDFFQKNIDKYPIFYPKGHTSIINALIGSGDFKPEIVEANFFHQEAAKNGETYPLKSSEEAFEELKEGKAYIASYFGEKTEITIKNIFLAYFLGEKKQEYLMPIIVFEGENGFLAYVSAVKDEWISK